MTKRLITLSTGALLATLLAFGPLGLAQAGTTAKTEVTQKIVDSGLKGKVKSVPECEAGRKVQLVETTQSGDKNVLKKAKADDNGKYKMGQVTFSDDVKHAWVEAPEKARSGVLCKKGRSSNII